MKNLQIKPQNSPFEENFEDLQRVKPFFFEKSAIFGESEILPIFGKKKTVTNKFDSFITDS